MLRTATRRALLYPAAAASAAAVGYPLDDVSNVLFGFSLQRLISDFSDPVCRLRRDTDDAESDFSLVGDQVSASAIDAWKGAGDAWLVGYYSQVGSLFTNRPAATQGLINTSGDVVFVEQTSSHYLYGSISLTTGTCFQIACYDMGAGGDAYRPSFQLGTNFTMRAYNDQTFPRSIQGYTTADLLALNVWPTGIHSSSVQWASASGELWVDGDSKDTGTVAASFSATYMRADGESDLYAWIAINADVSAADHNQIGAWIEATYGPTWTTVT